jgi:DNA-binding Lrp family transcriptional regulator
MHEQRSGREPTGMRAAPEPDGRQGIELDAIDAALLTELSRDARASFARLGAVVNLSAPAVKRRVDRLRRRGVIDGFTVRLDPALLGWATEAHVEVYCAGGTSPATIREAFERYPEIVAASTVTGEADAVVQVRAHDVRHLDVVVEQINAEPFVLRTRSSLVLTPLVRRPDLPPVRD